MKRLLGVRREPGPRPWLRRGLEWVDAATWALPWAIGYGLLWQALFLP